jgi:hypothetical protein
MSEEQAEYKIDGRPATIFRVIHDKDNPYVVINKTAIENPSLSFKAKGILAYLMSRPDGWEVSVADLVNRSVDGKASVRAGLQELEDAISQQHKYLRLNVEFHNSNVQLRADLGEARKVIELAMSYDNIAGDAASVFLSSHPGPQSKTVMTIDDRGNVGIGEKK